jgi:hypothetical protein
MLACMPAYLWAPGLRCKILTFIVLSLLFLTDGGWVKQMHRHHFKDIIDETIRASVSNCPAIWSKLLTGGFDYGRAPLRSTLGHEANASNPS